jgi:hypothetical protein
LAPIRPDIWTQQGEIGQDATHPAQGVADVDHGSFYKRDFWAQAVVDTNRQETGVEQDLSLDGTDISTREHDVAASMDHQS